MTAPPALITGGNGFLGSHLARLLVQRGHPVRVLYQPGTDLDRLRELDLEPMEGDLRDPASLARACAGQQWVFHLAAVVSDWGPRELFRAVNVEGTRGLLAAARAAGVQRLVFTSSLAVHRFRGITDGHEDLPRDNTALPCGASKIACEDLLLEAHRQGQVEAVIARPGLVPYGPGDRLSLPELARNHRRYVHVNRGRALLCTAYAPDLARGLLRCAEVPRAAGRVYVLADDETPSWDQLIGALFEGLGLPRPRRSFPLWAALAGAVLNEVWARLTRRPPLLTRYRVNLVGRDCVFHSHRAHRELGWRPEVPPDQALARTVEWLGGYLRETGFEG